MSLALNQDKAEIEKRMSPDSTRKLQDEINVLTKRNCELESQLRTFDSGNSRDFHFDSTDGPDSGKLSNTLINESDNSQIHVLEKMKELERMVKTLKQQRDESQKDKQDLVEKLKLQDKELKDALAQRKLAMSEYSEVSERLSELRQHKQKLSRQVGIYKHFIGLLNNLVPRFRLGTRKKNWRR